MHSEDYIKHQNEVKNLLRDAKGGDETAFSLLLTLYEPLLLSLTSKYLLQYDANDDKEDVHQELRVAFYKAANRYDLEDSSVDFGFFAKVCLKNALISRYRSKKLRGVEILPIEDAVGIYSDDNPGDSIAERESIGVLQTLINDNLSEYEKTVWNLYLEEKTPKQIGEVLGKDAKSISNALSRIRTKLRDLIGDLYNI